MENQIYNTQSYLEGIGGIYSTVFTKTVNSTQTYIKVATIAKSNYFTEADFVVFLNNQNGDTSKTAMVKFHKRGVNTDYCYVYNNQGFAISDFFTIDDGTIISLWVRCGVDPISSSVLIQTKLLRRYDYNVVFTYSGTLANGNVSESLPSGTIVNASGSVGNFLPLTNTTNALADPTNAQDAATKNYVDTTTVGIGGDVMTGPLVLSADPTVAQQAATKNYVDAWGSLITSEQTISYTWDNGGTIANGTDFGGSNSEAPKIVFTYYQKGKLVFGTFRVKDVNNNGGGYVGRGFSYSPSGTVNAAIFFCNLPFQVSNDLLIQTPFSIRNTGAQDGVNDVSGLALFTGTNFRFARNWRNATITSGVTTQYTDSGTTWFAQPRDYWWTGNFVAIVV